MVKASIITGGAAIGAVLLKFVLGSKKAGNIEVGDVRKSNVAIGDNIVQTQNGDVHNHVHLASSPRSNVDKVPTRPRVKEIMEAVNAAKPFDKHQIAENYVGLEVCWPVKYYSISPSDDENLWSITFDDGEVSRSMIVAKVLIEDYPKLRVIDVGHDAWIEGRINWVHSLAVFLENGAKITL